MAINSEYTTKEPQLSFDLARCTAVKLGGSVFDSLGTTLADMAALQKKGEPLVVVHGGANR